MSTFFIDLETRPAPERVRSWLEPQAPYEPLPLLDPDKLVDQALAYGDTSVNYQDSSGNAKGASDAPDWSKIAKSLGVRCGNLKDETKIMEKVLHALAESAQKEVDHLAKYEVDAIQAEADAFSKAALCPRTAEIFMIQWAENDGPVSILCQDGNKWELRRRRDPALAEIVEAGDGGEEAIISAFFDAVFNEHGWINSPGKPKRALVNWTGGNDRSNFDWNMLLRRALALGIDVPWLQQSRVLRPKFLDLTPEFLEHDKWNSFCSLEKACKELGIPTSSTPVTGATCWRFFEGAMQGDQSQRIPVEAREQKRLALDYAAQDIVLLRDIYSRMFTKTV